MTEILPVNGKSIQLARRLLREGEIVAFPTDTVYGLGASAFERFAVRQIFEAKRRPADMALPVFITQIDDLNQVAHSVPNYAWAFLQHFWPGALTVVLPKAPHLPDIVTAGQPTVAVRLPTTPSASSWWSNTANRWPSPAPTFPVSPPPLPRAGGRAAWRAHSAHSRWRPHPYPRPSSIVDLSVSPPRLLREGDLAWATLQQFLPDLLAPEPQG